MPTGYTAKLCEGPQEFDEFALDCARAFGACVTLRDEPNATIPEVFEPNDYHLKAANDAKAQLDLFANMSDEMADKQAEMQYQMEVAAQNESAQQIKEVRERLEAMLAKVEAWSPPTPDHAEMKEFMAQQLAVTIKWEGTLLTYSPERLTGTALRDKCIQQAKSDILYHHKKHAEEVKRCRERTEWVRVLRESLKGEA